MLGEERFDLVLNADSFTEMPLEQAQSYFTFCVRNCRALISSNHEANSFQVRDLAVLTNFTFQPLRSINAIRRGYVDEIFIFDANGGLAESERLKCEVSAARDQVGSMERSLSWKLTAPLRKIQRLMRKSPESDHFAA